MSEKEKRISTLHARIHTFLMYSSSTKGDSQGTPVSIQAGIPVQSSLAQRKVGKVQ